MTSLFLMRHAKPVTGHPMDATRPLVAEGVKQAEDMAEWLRKEHGRVDIVITSPFTRAMETAKIMADALGSHVADTRMLEPDGKPEEMWAEIMRLAQHSADVLVVGHDPSINAFLMWFTTGMTQGFVGPTEVRFEHGAIAKVRVGGEDANALHWLVNPKLVINQEAQEVEEAARELAEAVLMPDADDVEQNVKMRFVSDLEDGSVLVQLVSM